MFFSFVTFFLGLILLVKGASYLVDGASSLAKKLGISTIVIGLTIVAFGTSAPELIVNLIASLKGNTDIAIGNIIGSNIANILLILGFSAVVYPLVVKKSTTWKEIPLVFLAVVVVTLMANDTLIDRHSVSVLTRIDGFLLLVFFVIFLYYTYGISKVDVSYHKDINIYSTFVSLIMIIGGLSALTLGGRWLVESAIIFARALGASEALIGLTIVAVGTSLPELATSVMAAYKKNADIAVGNIIGSNIFNIFWILGISAVIHPLPFSSFLNFDLLVIIFTTLLLFIFMFIGKRHLLERWQGMVFVGLYVVYIGYLIIRG